MTTKTHPRKPIVPMSSVETIREQLLQLTPKSAREKEQRFAALYPVIQQLLADQITQRDILTILANNGVTLSPTRFKALLQKCSEMSATPATDIGETGGVEPRPAKPPRSRFPVVDVSAPAVVPRNGHVHHAGDLEEGRA